MSASGAWNLVVDTPMGQQEGSLDLTVDGDTVTGTSTAQGATQPIQDGSVDGDLITFSVKVTKPFPMTMAFELTEAGDDLGGEVAIGSFGKAKVKGTRA